MSRDPRDFDGFAIRTLGEPLPPRYSYNKPRKMNIQHYFTPQKGNKTKCRHCTFPEDDHPVRPTEEEVEDQLPRMQKDPSKKVQAGKYRWKELQSFREVVRYLEDHIPRRDVEVVDFDSAKNEFGSPVFTGTWGTAVDSFDYAVEFGSGEVLCAVRTKSWNGDEDHPDDNREMKIFLLS